MATSRRRKTKHNNTETVGADPPSPNITLMSEQDSDGKEPDPMQSKVNGDNGKAGMIVKLEKLLDQSSKQDIQGDSLKPKETGKVEQPEKKVNQSKDQKSPVVTKDNEDTKPKKKKRKVINYAEREGNNSTVYTSKVRNNCKRSQQL